MKNYAEAALEITKSDKDCWPPVLMQRVVWNLLQCEVEENEGRVLGNMKLRVVFGSETIHVKSGETLLSSMEAFVVV